MSSKTIVVVLGMHRSGTSALTRGLDALGLSLGDNLIPGRFDNEKGFWEDAKVNEFNESLLLSLGYLWHSNTSNLSLNWEDPELQQRKDHAVMLLSEKLPKEGIFAFKDPRTVVVLEFWQVVFAERNVAAERLNLELTHLGEEIDARNTRLETLADELVSTYQTLALRDQALQTRSAEFAAALSQQGILELHAETPS